MRSAGVIAVAVLLLGAAPAPPVASMPPAQWINTYQSALDGAKTYQATITAREYLNGNIQDRVYEIKFQKPSDVRLNVVGGDGKGSAAVWHGGDRVVGHQGGFLSMIHLNVNIHARIATSMRGRTIADAGFGPALAHIKSIKWKSLEVAVDGDRATLTGIVQDPAQNGGLTKEVVTLGANGLPVELTDYEGAGTIARHEVYTNVQTNVALPDSTWHV